MQQPLFKNQVAIITGAGIGIGYEVARQLALQGGSVVLNDMDSQLANLATAKIKAQGGICEAFAGDVSEMEVIDALMKFTVSKFSRVDIVIANAGITTYGDFLEYQPESMNKMVKVNLFGTFFLAQAAAKQMISQGNGGSILFTSSVTAHRSHANLVAYGMTKAGIEQLSKNLVVDLAHHNINTNSIAPGATLTERTLEDTEFAQTWSRITPSGRPATVEDIANAALFLVSPLSRQITGQNLIVDGGWVAVGVSPY